VCHEKITQRTGWRLHYCLARALGGSTSSENRVLLHPERHSTVHGQGLLSPNRASSEAFEGLEPCEAKVSCTVLRGLEGRKPVRLLDRFYGGATFWVRCFWTVASRLTSVWPTMHEECANWSGPLDLYTSPVAGLSTTHVVIKLTAESYLELSMQQWRG
jgi:hypothetical protein